MSLKIHVLLMGLLSVLLIVLFVNVRAFDTSEPSRVHGLLESLNRLDAESEQAMLQIYSHSMFDFDQLTSDISQLQRTYDLLVKEIPEGDRFAGRLQALRQSLQLQRQGANTFKSAFSVLSNSERYLPTLSAQISAKHPGMQLELTQLSRDVFQWQVYPDQTDILGRIRQQSERVKALGFDKLHQHIQIILTYGVQVLEAIDQAITCGTPENVMLLSDAYDHYFAKKVEENRSNQSMLILLGLLLLVYLLALIVSRQRGAVRLAESEKRFRMLFDLIPDGVGVHCEGKWIYCNPAAVQMFGAASEDELIGTAVLDRVHADMRPQVVQRLQDEVAQGRQASLMLQKNLRMDGSEFYGEVQGIPFMEDDRPVVMAVIRDVTFRVQAEREKTEQQEKMEHVQRLESLGILAGGIAHDFNNILTAVMGNAALAGRNMDDAAPAKEFLSRIEISTQRAADLCKQMLAYSGKGQFIIKAINLSDLVGEMTRLMEVSIKKNVVIKYHLAENLPVVEADAAQLQQVILNLITNANEAIGDKSGVISFSTGVMHADARYLKQTVSGDTPSEGRYVFVEVSDTGCGMDAKIIRKIFDPFFTTKFTGRGLGMSAVLGIVRGHHGALRVYSEAGKGTTFKILFPVASESLEQASNQLVVPGQWQPSGVILVVDDEETIREVASMMLEDMGFSVLTAEDGVDALAVYRQHQQEIVGVLMDMTMPKMDGKECFRELRRINADVKVILSSGYNELDATSRFVGQGLAGFIQKPYSPEALMAIVREVWGE